MVAFVPRHRVSEGDEVALHPSGPRPASELQAAYSRWADTSVGGEWSAVVTAVHPAAMLDPVAGAARHILAEIPDGDMVVLRVYGPEGAVLSDVAFEARVGSLEGALRG